MRDVSPKPNNREILSADNPSERSRPTTDDVTRYREAFSKGKAPDQSHPTEVHQHPEQIRDQREEFHVSEQVKAAFVQRGKDLPQKVIEKYDAHKITAYQFIFNQSFYRHDPQRVKNWSEIPEAVREKLQKENVKATDFVHFQTRDTLGRLLYENYYNESAGILIAERNLRKHDPCNMPTSEIWLNQRQRSLEKGIISGNLSHWALKKVYQCNIYNNDTFKALSGFVDANKVKRFVPEEDGHFAATGSANCRGITFLLKHHQDILGKRHIGDIEVKRASEGIFLDYIEISIIEAPLQIP